MLYDLVLINGDDRGSIMPVRRYNAPTLYEKTVENINLVMAQAMEETGLLTGEMSEAVLEFSPAWVEETEDETLRMLLSDEYITDSIGTIKSHSARAIAEYILKDFAETSSWLFMFDGANDDAFDSMDFKKFVFFDHRVDNSNLKNPIGSEVYVRYYYDEVFIYQGRPENGEISNGRNPVFTGNKVWATDENIIPVKDFSLKDYEKAIETFPLPRNVTRLGHSVFGAFKYFSREISGGKDSEEAFGKTKKQAKLRLAINMAFDAMDNAK